MSVDWNDLDKEDYIAQEEAWYVFTLQEFMSLFKKDPTGIVQVLVSTFDRQTCKDLASRLNRALNTAKVEQ